MRLVSTRGRASSGLSAAIRAGAAPDGGLFVPDVLPRVDWTTLTPDLPLHAFAAGMLASVFAGDPLADALDGIAAEAFDFPVPIATPDPARPTMRALELFHGPTGAFKDFGARFLIACLARTSEDDGPLTVLAATSGDTGGAVGCAAEGRAGLAAVILYPAGRVSPFQERQLTCWRAPVRALEVDGDFDDCQRLVKTAFADPALAARHRLTSANSINIGRLLPQAAYLAHAAVRVMGETGAAPGLIVPTGNLGHGFAALLARALGAPIGPVRLVTNANPTLSEWATTGRYAPRAAVATIANAMDVGAPSNFERVAALAGLLGEASVERVEDEAIRARIRADNAASGYVWCPHSATAAEAFARLPANERACRPWLLAATAHPFKFADVVEPLIGRAIAPPPALAAILDRPTSASPIAATPDALAAALAAA